MSHPLYRFGKAYQDELMRTKKSVLAKKQNVDSSQALLWQRITNKIGDGLISMGEKVKGDHRCPEFSRGQV